MNINLNPKNANILPAPTEADLRYASTGTNGTVYAVFKYRERAQEYCIKHLCAGAQVFDLDKQQYIWKLEQKYTL